MTFTVAGVPAAEVQRQLTTVGVNTSVSSAESARWDLWTRRGPDVVRASAHYYNDDTLGTASSTPCRPPVC